jgi:hypothetical protein
MRPSRQEEHATFYGRHPSQPAGPPPSWPLCIHLLTTVPDPTQTAQLAFFYKDDARASHRSEVSENPGSACDWEQSAAVEQMCRIEQSGGFGRKASSLWPELLGNEEAIQR